MGYTRRRQTNQYPMLPFFLDFFGFVFLCLVYPILPVSLDCFSFVCLRLVYPMLPVSLDCFQKNWKRGVHRTKTNKTKAIQRKW
jgi:hypothetical protein